MIPVSQENIFNPAFSNNLDAIFYISVLIKNINFDLDSNLTNNEKYDFSYNSLRTLITRLRNEAYINLDIVKARKDNRKIYTITNKGINYFLND